MILSFLVILLTPNLPVLILVQISFGLCIGLIYYSSLFYSMDVGETKGDVRQGMARIFVLWSEARTPSGVVVPLASPGTDELGRSGLPGMVDRHFLDRFGAALLISIVEGAVQGAVQPRSGSAVIVNPTAASDVVTEVLKSSINIPPTVRKRNGDRIQILVARDLDFRSVYRLRTHDK
jgi:type IV secretion system protein VirB10